MELTRGDDGNDEDDKITKFDGMMKMIGDDKLSLSYDVQCIRWIPGIRRRGGGVKLKNFKLI